MFRLVVDFAPPGAAVYTLTADAGAYTLSGKDATLTYLTVADTTAPAWGAAVLSGSSVTHDSYTLSAGANATDAAGVTGYRYRINGGAWVTGGSRSFHIIGRTPEAVDSCEMQARDAAGNWSSSISCSVTLAAAPAVGVISTTTITSTITGSAPFAFGQAFAEGDVPSGSALAGVQMNVISTWPDGSARTAIVSGSASLTAAVPHYVVLQVGSAPSGASLTTANLKATGISASIDAGAFGDAAWSGVDWDSPHKVWAAGPLMSSWVYRKPIGSDAHLVGWLEVRLWADGSVEVLPWIENGYLKVAGPTSKSETYTFTLGGSVRFSEAIDLPNHCRTPLVSGALLAHWLGSDKAVTIRHESSYLQRTRLVPAYRATVAPTSGLVTGQPATYTPLQQGSLPTGMGTAGYHPSIGVIPEWDVLYLTSTAPSLWSAVQRNAYSTGRYGIHFRDEATNLPIQFSHHPNLVLGGGSGISGIGTSTTGDYTTSATGTTPETFATSHHPSMGYFAHLLTGRLYHLETIQFVATANYLKNGNANRVGASGVMVSSSGSLTPRGMAWAFRTLAQAATVSADGDAVASELRDSLDANVSWYHSRYVAQPNCPQGWVEGYSDLSPPVVATTQAGSNSTTIVFPSGYVFTSDGYYIGWEIEIAGEVRQVTGYTGATRTATVSAAFTVPVASVPFELRSDNVLVGSTWMQDFITAAIGCALSLRPAGVDLDNLESLFHWKAQSVVGRFGSAGRTEYLYRDAAQYEIPFAPDNFPDWIGGTGPWYKSWGQLYDDTVARGTITGTREVGNLRGTSGANPSDPVGYWGNLLPALCYAVEHAVAGAYAAYLGLTQAANWPTLAANFNTAPVWGVVPPVEPSVPSWLPASGTFSDVGLNTLFEVTPTGWPTNDVGGPIINWCGGVFSPDFSALGAISVYGSGHLALNTDPLWAGVNHFDWSTRLWSMSNVPSEPTSDSTAWNTFFESTEAATLGHLSTPHTYDGLCLIPRNCGGGTKGLLRRHCFPGTSYAGSKSLHEFDISQPDAPPTRIVDALPLGGGAAGTYPMAAGDRARRGNWILANNGTAPLLFINWDTDAVTTFTGVGYGDYGDHSMTHIPYPWDCLVAGGRSNPGNTANRWFVCPIVDGVPAGFTEIFPSGTPVTDGRSGAVFDPQRDALVMHPGGAAGYTVFTLTPPDPSGSLLSGWAWGSTTLTGNSGAVPPWSINTNNGLPYANNGTWSKFQRVPITSTTSVYGHCGSIKKLMQAWRL